MRKLQNEGREEKKHRARDTNAYTIQCICSASAQFHRHIFTAIIKLYLLIQNKNQVHHFRFIKIMLFGQEYYIQNNLDILYIFKLNTFSNRIFAFLRDIFE